MQTQVLVRKYFKFFERDTKSQYVFAILKICLFECLDHNLKLCLIKIKHILILIVNHEN